MNAGPSGFAHAPVSKGLLLASVGSSLVANAARASHHRLPRPLVLASQALAFHSPGELLFGAMLLYYFRVLERQTGSRKYGSYAAVVTGLTYSLQLGAAGLLQLRPPPPGPLPLLFASFVPFLLDIPATSHFSVLGYRMSDKAFVYLAGLQLLLASGRQSLLVLGLSGLAGLLYRLNFCHLQRLRIPNPLVRIISRLLGPLLTDPRSSGPSIILVGPQQQQQHGGPGGHQQQHGGGGFGEGFYQGATQQASHAQRHGGGAGAAAAPAREPSPEALDALLAMGFSRERATAALQQAGNDLQTAIALLVG